MMFPEDLSGYDLLAELKKRSSQKTTAVIQASDPGASWAWRVDCHLLQAAEGSKGL